MLWAAGCSTVQACHLPWYASGGKLTRVPQFTKSDFFTTPLSSRGIGTLLAGIEALQRVPERPAASAASPSTRWAARSTGSRRAPPRSCTATRCSTRSTPPTGPSGRVAAASTTSASGSRSSGTRCAPTPAGRPTQNYIDPTLANWQQAYYGANYHRLQLIKQKYDPHPGVQLRAGHPAGHRRVARRRAGHRVAARGRRTGRHGRCPAAVLPGRCRAGGPGPRGQRVLISSRSPGPMPVNTRIRRHGY